MPSRDISLGAGEDSKRELWHHFKSVDSLSLEKAVKLKMEHLGINIWIECESLALEIHSVKLWLFMNCGNYWTNVIESGTLSSNHVWIEESDVWWHQSFSLFIYICYDCMFHIPFCSNGVFVLHFFFIFLRLCVPDPTLLHFSLHFHGCLFQIQLYFNLFELFKAH